MAFSTIDAATIEVGDPVKAELFAKIKANEDDHETRINSVEATAKKIDVFKFLLINGSSFPTATGVAYFRAEDDFTITKAAFQIFEKGSETGFAEIDIKKSTTNLNGASFTTIMTTKPKITYSTASDYDETSNQIINASSAIINSGDYLRLDITITPGSTIFPKSLITVYGE